MELTVESNDMVMIIEDFIGEDIQIDKQGAKQLIEVLQEWVKDELKKEYELENS